MSQSQTQCPVHGREGIGLVCEHIAFAVTVASGSASFGAMTPIPPVRMPGAWSAGKRCLPSMVRHPSSGSAALISRCFVPNAGMRPKPSAADLRARTCDRGAAFLSSGRYHHHLGITVWQSAGAGTRDEAATGLAWFSLEVEKQDLFAAEEQRPLQAGAQVAALPSGLEAVDSWGARVRLVKV
jgi:hypothetical protein